MLKIHENYSLIKNNTFSVDIASSRYTEPASTDEIIFAVEHARKKGWNFYVIGEGSNLLFTKDYDGLIIHPAMKRIHQLDESSSEVLIKAEAGVNWDSFVAFCVENNWYGTENLSLIPGSVGASPVQNIGAYGVEAKDIIAYVEVIDLQEMQPKLLSNVACEFGYRDSIFKHGTSGRYIVTSVIFNLKKRSLFKLDYGNVKEKFLQQEEQNLKTLRETIISIRESKLPDPAITGNAGSFFKNPVISDDLLKEIQAQFPDIPHYHAGNHKKKIPAAWLIETAGWKGVREGDVGTWPLQSLVIVNYGSASGQQIDDFSEKIRLDVLKKFNITLEREVTVIS